MRKILFCISLLFLSVSPCIASDVPSADEDSDKCFLETSHFQYATLDGEGCYVWVDKGVNGDKYLIIGHRDIVETGYIKADYISKIILIETDVFCEGVWDSLNIETDSMFVFIIRDFNGNLMMCRLDK